MPNTDASKFYNILLGICKIIKPMEYDYRFLFSKMCYHLKIAGFISKMEEGGDFIHGYLESTGQAIFIGGLINQVLDDVDGNKLEHTIELKKDDKTIKINRKQNAIFNITTKDDVNKFKNVVGTDFNIQIEDGYHTNINLLNLACKYGAFQIVKYLVENKFNINEINDDTKIAPIMTSVINGKLEILKYLIENGANIKIKNDKGENLLIIAAENSKFDIIKFLLEIKFPIDEPDNNGFNALCNSVDSLEIVKLLIDGGANINYNYNDKITPLNMAIIQNQIETVKYLLENGAKIINKKFIISRMFEINIDKYKNIIKLLVNYMDFNFIIFNNITILDHFKYDSDMSDYLIGKGIKYGKDLIKN